MNNIIDFNPQPKPLKIENPAYLKFVRSHQCCVYGCCNTDIQAHHVQEQYYGIMGGKDSDYQTAPLCFEHHRGDSGIHTLGRGKFYNMFEVDFYKVMFRLLKEWVEK